jgi:hypothetical protein
LALPKIRRCAWKLVVIDLDTKLRIYPEGNGPILLVRQISILLSMSSTIRLSIRRAWLRAGSTCTGSADFFNQRWLDYTGASPAGRSANSFDEHKSFCRNPKSMGFQPRRRSRNNWRANFCAISLRALMPPMAQPNELSAVRADSQQLSRPICRPNGLSPGHRHTRCVDIELVESAVRIVPGAV